MIHVVTDRRRAPALVEAMHRDRKAVFVDRLGWELPVIGDLEVDAFDTPQATYLIAATDDGDHLGSLRLLPTTRPHLLGALFPTLCAGGVPTGPDIVEVSRLVLSPRLRAATRLRVRQRLIAALAEHGLAAGLTRYTCMAGTAWLSQIMAMGWRFELLGPPQTIGGEAVGALLLHVDEATLAHFRRAWRLTASDLAPALADAA